MYKTAEDIRQLNERISHAGQFTDKLREEVSHVIVGQSHMLDRLLIGLLSNGHVLLEGVPGLAKTLTIKSLSQAIHAIDAVNGHWSPNLGPTNYPDESAISQFRGDGRSGRSPFSPASSVSCQSTVVTNCTLPVL